MVEHLYHHPLHPALRRRKNSQAHQPHVRNRRIGNQPLQVILLDSHQRGIDHPDNTRARDSIAPRPCTHRQDRRQPPDHPEKPHLHHHRTQYHGNRIRRLLIRIRLPGMQRPDRHLDRKGSEEQPKQPHLILRGNDRPHSIERLHRKGMVRRLRIDQQQPDQHQQAAHKRIDKEFESHRNPPLATPLTAQEIHRYQRQFPEEIEQQRISRQEHPHQARLR